MSEAKTALVTGGSRGIGQALVERLLAHGFRVLTCSRSIKPRDDGTLITLAGDVCDPAFVKDMVETAASRFGRIDTLVNNAGLFLARPFTDYTPEEFQKVLAVNLGAFFHTTQQVLRHMLQRGQGHVVNITTSVLAEQPVAQLPASLTALTKGGLNAVTRSLAIEYAARGIRVNAIAPGVVRTPMHDPQHLGALASFQPVGRIGEPEEIADALLFLEQAHFVTGEILHLDGGAHAGRW